MRRANLQVKFGLSYILVIAAVLVFMNTYPLIVSENLVVRSKQTTLQSSVSVMVTALSGLEELSEENVASAMTLVEDTGISRILVTDAAGRILYDTRETDGAVGRYGLYTEIVQALRGYDAFYADFTDGAFRSRAASPVIYRSQTIGAVYAYEYDVEQATLLLTLQKNLLRISAAVAGFVVLLSLLLSRMLTRRFGVLLEAIRRVREGAYSYHAEIGGRDEISEIAEEFNSLSDRLQTTEEARRRFVSDASHELKTPLAGIRLLSDSILQTEDIDAATVREFVGDIVQETDRLTRITENLLRLTRLDSGIVEPAQSVAVAPVIERVVRMLRLVADEKRVELTYLVEREQSVRAGVDDLHQIIYNLTENAIKYNRPGGFVRVTLGGTEDECVLRVEDNGIGIPEEDMPRVFDRFYRVDKMRSRAAGGTGLGLSIVADTVRRRGRRHLLHGAAPRRAEGGGDMRRKAFLFTFLVLSLLLAACVRSGGTEGENSYTIYYPAAELRDVPGEDAIVARTVQLPDADTLTQEELAQRLLERLLADAPDAGVRAPMPGGTTLLSLSVLGNWARVDFSRQYARLAGIDLTLADYCVTLTLTQLDGVNAVSITSGGRELPYRETQTLTAADPLLSMREDALRPITVSLYFLDPTSGALRAEKRALALYEGQTRVNALLEALAQGPESGALAALLPEEFTVLSARVEEGTCYLNLPSDADLGISPRQTVESLVLSLCSLDTVERVQIVVDGEIAAQLNGVNVGEPLTP